MNFVIHCQNSLGIHSRLSPCRFKAAMTILWGLMTKINNRTAVWKTDVNMLNGKKDESICFWAQASLDMVLWVLRIPLKPNPNPNQLLASFILSQLCVSCQCLVQAPGLKRGCLSGIGAFQNGLVILEINNKPLACEAWSL